MNMRNYYYLITGTILLLFKIFFYQFQSIVLFIFTFQGYKKRKDFVRSYLIYIYMLHLCFFSFYTVGKKNKQYQQSDS